MPLRNLRPLRESMREEEQAVSVILFEYKGVEYFLAVCLLTEDERNTPVHRYDLVRLCFMQSDNLAHFLDCYANSNSITAGLTELRHFLNVEYQKDGIGWKKGFLKFLGDHIPAEVPPLDINLQPAAIATICRNEGRDPERTYRWSLIRHLEDEHGNRRHRTEYNGQLASFKFPILYPRFRQDRTVSFGFTNDASREKSEEEILRNFEANERKKTLKKTR